MSLNTSVFNREELAATPIPAEPSLLPQAAPAASHAIRVEGADAAATRATSYTMAVGDTFNGTLSSGADQDWVRMTLQPGTYVITLDGRGANGVGDPILRGMNGSGAVIRVDDDGGDGTNSRMVLEITTAGTYYVAAGSYAGSDAGDYSIRINEQWRLCFVWADGHASQVEIVDYH